ncbi:MAG: dihydrolipoamide acetyltransferase family protein [Armatimonadota bacterium]|jgi:pyruvate dehydrogenase E2 component (dihydrolipoamide acetyltransferase)|nr:2-oxo acid dehydrogenase subunit E2 [Fimbriimonadaceae bacterium]MCZ8139907.1 dihydrolipoamide acetyltransferase family protein [Fimbriimonadaceae bacterium]
MTEVIMPKMGDGMEEGTLLEWLKKDGESVKPGEVIGTIQTDKATLELESPGRGKLTGFLIQSGDTVPVGRPIAAILKDGESLPANWGSGEASAPASEEPVAATEAPAASAATPAATTSSSNERIKASPLARRVAADAGVDLSAVTGSGPGGRIVHKDVVAAIGQQGSSLPKAAPKSAPVVASAEDVKVPLNFLRKIIAERTHQSKMEAPHFYVTVEVDMEKIYTLREALKEEEAGNISVNDFVVRACALALREMPQVNSTYQGDYLLQLGNVNIGIAAAVDDGLLVPVIHHADQLTLRQIAAASKDLVTKARAGKLSPNEMSGSTFSISNMGMLDVDNFGAIINGPNAAILAISSARKKVVVTESDEVEVRWRMNMTASFDHRVVDGAVGAQFINIVRAYLESPMRLLS